MKKCQKNSRGITLVALVITIIILLILAGISIQAITGTGLFEKAIQATAATEIANIKEQIMLDIYEKQLANTGSISDSELETILGNYGTIIYEEDNETIKGILTDKGYEILLADIWSGSTTGETLVADGTWQKSKGVNSPELLEGMTPIKFIEPTSDTEGETKSTEYTDEEWYDYTAKKWANAQTKDGSMWVWIPRYAYRINSDTQTCDIVFLIGTTDNYYDKNGDIQTAKRQTTEDETIDTTTGYTVHPAFTDESSISYANGGWDKELSGIWVAKFEAGYASGNNSATVKASSVSYTQSTAWVAATEAGTSSDSTQTARNWLDGIYGTTTTSIKYPTFQGLTYSMNYINHNDAYNISKVLTENGNIYGLNNSTTDSHLMKNSEWGAVSYLSQSKYGLNGTNIYINDVSLNNSTQSVYAVTGCAGATEDASTAVTTITALNSRTASNVYVWTEENGTKASSTGTIYGIYDLSGGTWERTAALVANGNSNLSTYGSSLLNDGVSTKYVTVYPSNDSGITTLDTASSSNYAVNTKIYGDAIRETSTSGTGSTSWYSDHSYFAGYTSPFFIRGGRWYNTSSAGLFCFFRYYGGSSYTSGFRAVLVAE